MKQRNSNIEFLRIVSILLILLSHYTMHSGIHNYELSFGFNRFLLETCTLGNIGTIIFILITGYFMINSKNISIKKVIQLIVQVQFYSFIIFILLVFLGHEHFTIKNIITSLFPITFKQYWFITSYFVLYLMSPFINKLLNNINRKQHLLFNYLCVGLFFIIPTITTMDFYGNEVIQFITIYSIGAYLQKYNDNLINNNSLKIMIVSVVLLLLSIIVIDFINVKYNVLVGRATYFLKRTSPLCLLFSISFFSIFSQKKQKNNSKINYISTLILSVYLISDNRLLRNIIWVDIFQNYKYVDSCFLIIHVFISILLLFFVCIVIEIIRKIIDKHIFMKLNNKIILLQDKINNYIE